MAPTEILSEQHWRKFNEWLAPLGVRLGYLRGGMRKKEKKRDAEGARADRHARPDPGRRRVRAPRPGGGRRAAPLRRRAAPRAAQEGGRRGAAPAHDERDADPAHPVDDLLRRPRCLDDRRAAAGAPPGADANVLGGKKGGGSQADSRGLRGRAAGVLGMPGDRGVQGGPAHRARDLREAARGAEDPAGRPAAWAHAGGGKGRHHASFSGKPYPSARGHDGDRGGRRRAERLADGDRERRALRAFAAAPAARAHRPRHAGERLHPALRRAAGQCARAAEGDLREHRRLRDRARRTSRCAARASFSASARAARRCCASPISSATRTWSRPRCARRPSCSTAIRPRRARTSSAGWARDRSSRTRELSFALWTWRPSRSASMPTSA